MAEGLISEIILQDAIQAQIDFLNHNLDDLAARLKSFPQIKSFFSDDSGIKTVAKAHNELTISLNEYKKIQDQLATTTAKLNVLETEHAKNLANLKVQQKQVNDEIANQAKVTQTATGSLDNLKARVAELTRQRNIIPAFGDENLAKIELFNKRINNLNQIIARNQDDLSKRKINIGNYEGSAKIIVDAFERARLKVAEVGQQFGQSSPEAQAARREFEALDRITANPQFLNVSSKIGDNRAEILFFTNQLSEMRKEGLQDTETFKEVENRISELTRSMRETRQEIRALSSDTRAFDLFASSVNTAASIFEAGAGAAQLFGSKSQEAEEAIRKLIAVQALANGVREIARQITEKGTAANKLYNFVLENTKNAFDSSASAATRWTSVLKLGIAGIAVGAIVLLIANINKLNGETARLNDGLQSLDGVSGQTKRALREMGETISEVAQGQIKELTSEIKKLNDELGLSPTQIQKTQATIQLLNNEIDRLQKKSADLNKVAPFGGGGFAAAATSTANQLKENNKQVGILIQQREELNHLQDLADTKAHTASVLHSIIDDAQLQIDANNRLLNSDTQTFKQRSDLLKDNLEERKRIIQKQKDLDLAAIVGFDEQATIKRNEAKRKADKDSLTAERDYQEQLQKLREHFHDLQVKAIEEEKKAKLDLLVFDKNQRKAEADIIAENAEVPSNLRIKAAQAAAEIEKEILDAQTQFEIDTIKRSEAELKRKGEFTVEQAKADAAKIDVINNDAAEKEAKIAADLSTRIVQIRTSSSTKVRDEFKQVVDQMDQEAMDAEQNRLNTQIQLATISQNQELKIANETFQKKFEAAKGNQVLEKKAQEDFAKEKEEIERKTQAAILKIQIDSFKAQIQLLKLAGKDTLDLQAQLSKLEADLAEINSTTVVKSIDKKREAWDKLATNLESFIKTFNEFARLEEGFANALFTRQKNTIQDQIDKVDELRQKDIDRINASADSEEQKANKIKLIEAKSQADKERLQKQQKEIDIREAQFQKSFTIMQIILKNALAIASANAIVNPVIRAAQLAQAIAVGAAELAIAIATPIPKFARGTKSAPGGLAWVGEEGPELAIEPGGKMKLFTKPTLTDLMQGTEVKTADVTRMMINNIHYDFQRKAEMFGMAPNIIVVKDNREVVEELQELNSKKPVNLIVNNYPDIKTTAHYIEQLKR